MIDKNKIIEKFKKKIIELKKHNKLYFNYDNPEISLQCFGHKARRIGF